MTVVVVSVVVGVEISVARVVMLVSFFDKGTSVRGTAVELTSGEMVVVMLVELRSLELEEGVMGTFSESGEARIGPRTTNQVKVIATRLKKTCKVELSIEL